MSVASTKAANYTCHYLFAIACCAPTAEPTINVFKLDVAKDEFIIIGTDGLWDVFSPEDAVAFVHRTLSGSIGALGDDDVETARLST